MATSYETLNQAAVEQATGLSREVLRKWEIRFQFPQPLRDARDQRLYTPEDVAKLQCIRRLIARGHKPRHLMPLSIQELEALLESGVRQDGDLLADSHLFAQEVLTILSAGRVTIDFDALLKTRLQQVGLDHFVQCDMPACNARIGEAWVEGRLPIHSEHRYTQTVQVLVQRYIADLRPSPHGKKVLLTTPPGELHSLALLAFQAVLTLRGAQCINLGTQTPAASVAEAVIDLDVSMVCLSASASLPAKAVRSYMLALRKQVPKHCELWLGGSGAGGLFAKPMTGVTAFLDVQSAIDRWEFTFSEPKA